MVSDLAKAYRRRGSLDSLFGWRPGGFVGLGNMCISLDFALRSFHVMNTDDFHVEEAHQIEPCPDSHADHMSRYYRCLTLRDYA